MPESHPGMTQCERTVHYEDDGHRVASYKDLTLFKGPDIHSGTMQVIFISPERNISALETKYKNQFNYHIWSSG